MVSRLERYNAQFSQKSAYFGADVEAKPIPAPLGGLDAISPISAMDPKYALILQNWVPRPGYVELRGGYNAWVQGLNSNSTVETLMTYRPAGASEQLFAAGGSRIYNVSNYALPTIVQTGRANARNQYINYTPANSSSYLAVVNGADPYTIFDGTNWTQPAIAGVSSSSFIGINAFKRRIWFIPINSTTPYYLDTDAIQGTANPFPIGAFMTKGGFVMAMGTWTVDGGTGPDDLAVFITSKGQAIIYKGTDPTNANAWALVGVFDLPLPLGRRCLVKLGSDLGIITLQGLIPISQALPFDPAGVRSVALTNQIQNAMLQAAQQGSNLFGWEAHTFTQQTLLIMNYPIQENQLQQQFVMNFLTGAWCQFTNWNANCFEIFNESLYFADNKGDVNLAYTSQFDLVSPITANMKCAFNYFDDPGRIKNMRMLRPLLVADGTITPTVGVDVDFGSSSITAPVSLITPSGGLWDVSLWDVGTWSSGSVTVNNWLSVTALGTALAVKMAVSIAPLNSATVASSVFDTGVFDTAIFDGSGSITSSGQNLTTLQLNSFEALMEFGGSI